MKFSLINIHSQAGDYCSGNWIQNHIGTLETAIQLAKDTNKINGNRLNIAIVDELPQTNPALHFHHDKKLLATIDKN